jgi:hypothetical protein
MKGADEGLSNEVMTGVIAFIIGFLLALAFMVEPAKSHSDWEWIARGFPDYHSQYNKSWSCCGEHDIERLATDRWTQEGDFYIIDDKHRFEVRRAYPSEEGYAVIAWHLGDWVDSSNTGGTKIPNVPGEIYNGRHIIGIHCFFFAPGGV